MLCLWPFGLRLRDRTCGEAELDFFAALIVCDIWGGYTFHTEYLDLVPITTRECILDTREARRGDKTGIIEEGKRRTFLVRACGPVVCELQDHLLY
jgi:hypothetical protein